MVLFFSYRDGKSAQIINCIFLTERKLERCQVTIISGDARAGASRAFVHVRVSHAAPTLTPRALAFSSEFPAFFLAKVEDDNEVVLRASTQEQRRVDA